MNTGLEASPVAASPITSRRPVRSPRRRAPQRARSSVVDLVPPPAEPLFRASPSSTMLFRIDLDMYRGPLDLLLYLVRKHEVELAELPLARITTQYLDYLAVLEVLDVNDVGDFLEMASWLIELKSKALLPDTEAADDSEDPLEEPGQSLVEQLLAYKQYRDAASILEERGRTWSQHFARLANDIPTREVDPSSQPIHEIELWDLVSALGRVLRANELAQPASIVYDDTPIQTHMQRIHERLREDGQVAFSDMFQAGMNKSTLIGVFLAVLELVRHHCVYAEQEETYGEIYLKPGPEFQLELAVDEVDEYAGGVKPR